MSSSSSRSELPITDWEIEEYRFQIPRSLRMQAGIKGRVVRVPVIVDRKIRDKHPSVVGKYESLNQVIDSWDAFREREGRIEVYFEPDTRGNRLMVVVGYDRNLSLNLISMYEVRQRNWRNRALQKREQR